MADHCVFDQSLKPLDTSRLPPSVFIPKEKKLEDKTRSIAIVRAWCPPTCVGPPLPTAVCHQLIELLHTLIDSRVASVLLARTSDLPFNDGTQTSNPIDPAKGDVKDWSNFNDFLHIGVFGDPGNPVFIRRSWPGPHGFVPHHLFAWIVWLQNLKAISFLPIKNTCI